MSLHSQTIVGTIRLEPAALAADAACDDTSLGQLLETLAGKARLHDAEGAFRVVTTRRLSRSAQSGGQHVVRADLAQLLEDLQAEFKSVRRQ